MLAHVHGQEHTHPTAAEASVHRRAHLHPTVTTTHSNRGLPPTHPAPSRWVGPDPSEKGPSPAQTPPSPSSRWPQSPPAGLCCHLVAARSQPRPSQGQREGVGGRVTGGAQPQPSSHRGLAGAHRTQVPPTRVGPNAIACIMRLFDPTRVKDATIPGQLRTERTELAGEGPETDTSPGGFLRSRSSASQKAWSMACPARESGCMALGQNSQSRGGAGRVT